jgi:beta-galactosidase beta subunit
MIASKAIKVYASVGQPDGEYVTTVFTPHDAHRMKLRLFKRKSVRRVIFKTLAGNELTFINDRVQRS